MDDGDLPLGLAALLGVLQGLTEFLPVSSSGHLALAQAYFGVDTERVGHRFNVFAHGGTLLAVLWVYRADLVALGRAVLRPKRSDPSLRLLFGLAIATVPLAVALIPGVEAGLLAIESRPRWVGVALLGTAAILLLGSRRRTAAFDGPPSPGRALLIGLAQLLAVTPGISRSGTTISAALGLGCEREQAARFSFLLAVPAIIGACTKEILGAGGWPPGGWAPLLVGFATSAVVGVVVLRWLIRIVRRGALVWFLPYLLVVGSMAVILG